MITLTKEQLMEQRDHILIEINYHEILEFCEAVTSGDSKPFIEYENVTELRAELKDHLDEFIASHLADPTYYKVGYSNKWLIEITREEEREEWRLRAAFEYLVTDQEGR